MTALYIILGIIAFFVLLFSIRITIKGKYFDEFALSVSWLFLKFQIFPLKKNNKPKKEKKPKPPKKKNEEAIEETPAETKENIFVTFYKNQGFDGVIQLLNNAAVSVGKMLSSLKKHIIIRELYLWITVTGNCDAAETALQYGRACQKIFPALSFLCANMKVKKYDVEVEPDFLGYDDTAQFAFSFSLRPIFLTNALVVLVCRLLVKVVLKFLRGIKNKTDNNEKINEGGAL